jgi:hypothetical protein
VDDWNGFIYPTYTCAFQEDKIGYEEFAYRIRSIGINLYQTSPIIFTNNYGTLSGGASWIQCPDGSSGVNFDGIDEQISWGDASDLDVGTGDFSLALCLYTNSLASEVRVLSKKTDSPLASIGYNLLISTGGQITFNLSDGTHQDVLTSASAIITNQTWKLIAITIDRDGNGTIYVNNSASGTPAAITASGSANNSNNFYLGRAEGVGYGNFRGRNIMFAKKVWTAAELSQLWDTWRGIFGV